MTNQVTPKATFEEKPEPVLQFLANPYKLWEKGNTALRRTILKQAFSDHIQYDRLEGPGTPQIALPFKALKAVCNHQMKGGAAVGSNLEPICGDEVLQIMEEWSQVIKGDDELVRMLAALEVRGDDDLPIDPPLSPSDLEPSP